MALPLSSADHHREGAPQPGAPCFSGGLLMFLFTLLSGMTGRSAARPRRSRYGPGRGRPARRLVLEVLEDRLCPSGGYLLVASFGTNSVQRYDETTGAYVDTFVDHHSGGLAQPF